MCYLLTVLVYFLVELSCHSKVEESSAHEVVLGILCHVFSQISSRDLHVTSRLSKLTLHKLQRTDQQVFLNITVRYSTNLTVIRTRRGILGTVGCVVMCTHLINGLEVAVLALPWTFGAGIGVEVQVPQLPHPVTSTLLVGTANFQLFNLSFEVLVHLSC